MVQRLRARFRVPADGPFRLVYTLYLHWTGGEMP